LRRWFDDVDEEKVEVVLGFADAFGDLSKDAGK
jgi:hypothetical protein